MKVCFSSQAKLTGCMIAVIVLVTGCQMLPPFKEAPEPGKDKALLYVFRPESKLAASEPPDIYINKKKLLTIKEGTYTHVYLNPGKYTLYTKRNIYNWTFPYLEIEFKATAGNTYYVRMLPEPTETRKTGSIIRESISLISKEQARKDIAKTGYAKPANSSF